MSAYDAPGFDTELGDSRTGLSCTKGLVLMGEDVP